MNFWANASIGSLPRRCTPDTERGLANLYASGILPAAPEPSTADAIPCDITSGDLEQCRSQVGQLSVFYK